MLIADPLEIELIEQYRCFLKKGYAKLIIERHEGRICFIEREKVKSLDLLERL